MLHNYPANMLKQNGFERQYKYGTGKNDIYSEYNDNFTPDKKAVGLIAQLSAG